MKAAEWVSLRVPLPTGLRPQKQKAIAAKHVVRGGKDVLVTLPGFAVPPEPVGGTTKLAR